MNCNILQKKTYYSNEAELRQSAQIFAKICQNNGMFIYLSGQLGAGKTTWVRGFLEGLGYKERVKSPTYSLVESYEIQGQLVHHFDLYRLGDVSELYYLGLDDYFKDSAICLVEWPDHFLTDLPKPDVMILFEFEREGRLLTWQKRTEKEGEWFKFFSAPSPSGGVNV